MKHLTLALLVFFASCGPLKEAGKGAAHQTTQETGAFINETPPPGVPTEAPEESPYPIAYLIGSHLAALAIGLFGRPTVESWVAKRKKK